MTKSVDESAAPGKNLNEESEVIELTEEVGVDRSETHPNGPRPDAPQDGDGEVVEDEFDAFTREMPEFRVPDDVGSAEGPPGAAIISGRRRPAPSEQPVAENKPAAERSPAGTSPAETSPAEASPVQRDSAESEEEAESVEDLRAFAAKTLQLSAVSREEMERHYYRERLSEAKVLEDHRFAPDVLISPPRLLTTEWQDGGPLKRASLATAERRDTVQPESAQPEAAQPETIDTEVVEAAEAPAVEPETDANADPAFDGKQTLRELKSFDEFDEFDEEDLPELDPDSVEMDLDELDPDSIEMELDPSEPKPPPKPADPRPGSPPKLPVSASAPPADATPPPESELGGLVQEILEESVASGPAAAAAETGAQQPGKSRPKRARNRPRGPRETWFQKVFTDEYFRTLPSDVHRQTRREADFIEASLNLQEGDRLLDLACGFGRHSIELTRRGHEVVGIDLSMHMLQKALNEAQRQELSIKFIHGDMRELKFDGIFSDCLLWQTSFGFFDDQTNFRVLRGIHRALRPDGELLIEMVNRDHIAPRMPHRLWWEGVNCVFLEEVELDHRTSVLHTKRSFIYEDGTPPLEQSFYIRLYSPHELRHLLHAAGFTVLELSGELHHRGQFLGSASTRIVIRAKKRPLQKGAATK